MTRLGSHASALGLLTLSLAFGGGCRDDARSARAGPASPVASAAPRPRVVCTIGMIRDAAGRIAGNRAEVVGLMGEGVDPHLYKASPGDVRLLSEAQLVLYNGLNLEGKLGDLLVRLARRTPTVPVTERIDESRLRSPPEFRGHYDPHVWFDVSLWMQSVERIREALIELDPAGRGEYASRTDAYLAELSALHDECRRELATVPRASRVLVTAHDAFGYFGRAYDVDVHGIQGISTESEPSLKDINALVDLLVSRRVKAVFVESSVPPKYVEALVEGCRSRDHPLQIGGSLYSDALGAAGTPEGTYVGMVRHNVRTIVSALR